MPLPSKLKNLMTLKLISVFFFLFPSVIALPAVPPATGEVDRFCGHKLEECF